MDKEKWIQEIMNSTAGKAAAEPAAGFAERFINRLAADKKVAPVISIKWIRVAACAACLLLVFNISLLNKWKTYYSNTEQRTATTETAINTSSPENLNEDYNFFN